MIARNRPPWEPGQWRERLRQAIDSPAELARELGLEALPEIATGFPLRVPRGFVARMAKGDPGDPLLRQVLPVSDENRSIPGFSADPVGELGRTEPGWIRKYRGRALLVLTGSCAVHCRYCFRRHFPYGESSLTAAALRQVLDELKADPSIEELIFSGGDPLQLADARLAELVRAFESVASVKRLRIHTRLPIVIPERVDADLLAWLGATRFETVMVVHANHAAELDSDVRRALALLRDSCAALLNQSVLLAGVNDSAPALAALSRALFAAGVLPYYLHALDRVAGAAHFEVPEARTRQLLHELAAELPGYLVPRFVREEPGRPYKVPISPADVD